MFVTIETAAVLVAGDFSNKCSTLAHFEVSTDCFMSEVMETQVYDIDHIAVATERRAYRARVEGKNEL
jgi:hypothetical protein